MEEETPYISKKLLELLRCPITGAKLELKGDCLVNENVGVSYPIVDGVPIMRLLPKRKEKKLKRKSDNGK